MSIAKFPLKGKRTLASAIELSLIGMLVRISKGLSMGKIRGDNEIGSRRGDKQQWLLANETRNSHDKLVII